MRFLLKVAACAAAIVAASVNLSAGAQRGRDARGFNETMGLSENAKLPYSCQYLKSTAPVNILWPGEQAEFTFQLTNNSKQPIHGLGSVEIIPYGSYRDSSDKSIQVIFKNGTPTSTAIAVDLAPGKSQDITVKPKVPERLGGYGLVVDLGKAGRTFVTTFVRTFKPDPMTIHYPQITCDGTIFQPDVIARLGVPPNRLGFGYTPTTSSHFDKYFEGKCAQLEELQQAKLPVTVEFGMPSSKDIQPLGRPRPHLDENGAMRGNGGDLAWLPSYDADFKKLVKMVLEKYGWPRGTVIGVKFMNEPWDFASISGWGADPPRYREIYKAMAEATEEARKEYGVEVMIGGCDSSTNTFDKLFADGKDDFLKYLDFCSLHYQGLNVPTTYKPWLERKGPYGPVQIWETEGSYAEDKVAAAVATNLAAGLKHVVSIWFADISTTKRATKGKGGTKIVNNAVDVWSPAAALGGVAHFIGQRKFKELLFANGLPWVMVFGANPETGADPEDGTVVIVGDIGAEFTHDCLPFRNARGAKEVAELAKLKAKLAALTEDSSEKERRTLQRAIRFGGVLSNASLTLANAEGKFHLYDLYGNEIPPENGKTVVPLDSRGFFLRGDGKPGSFAALLDAIRKARVEGIEPLAKKCHDMLSPVDKDRSSFRLELTNVLNRPIHGSMSVRVEGLKVEPASQQVSFAANQAKVFTIKVSGTAKPDNTYHFNMVFDAGADGKSVHGEDMHVNLIAKRTITVDGDLKDWQGVPPQTIKVEGISGPTEAEKAWRPWEDFGEGDAAGFALGYLAYDDKYFYFAAKVADSTPDGGTLRFETRDEDQFFYPETSYEFNRNSSLLLVEGPPRTGAGAFAKNRAALLSPDGKRGERCGSIWESPAGAMALDLDLPSDKRSQIALYFVDPDRFGECEKGIRSQTVEVLDRKSGKVLDHQNLSTFGPGVYAIYEMSGDVRIKVSTTKYTPRMSAVFFDPSSNPGTPASAQGAYARFEKFDTTTHGDWKGAYGKSGLKMAGANDQLPPGVAIAIPKSPSAKEYHWPAGVRRFSYARNQIAPWHGDSVQIAFNAIEPARKDWIANPPGTMPGYIGYKDTDYEYSLNKVAGKFGGGTEIWRDSVPGMPHTSLIPRQGKSSFDGPVKDGKLVVLQGPTTRIVECAVPWTEIPEVKKKCDAGETIKFSFRVNDDREKNRCMELARDRSASQTNNFQTFRPDGGEHWANEIEFAFEK